MLKPDRQSASNLRLVASSDRPSTARPKRVGTAVALVVDERPRRQLLRTMNLVADARRHAAVRLRRKSIAGRTATLWLAVVTAWAIGKGTTAQPVAVAGMLGVIGMLLLFRPGTDQRISCEAATLERCAADIDALAGELTDADARDGSKVHVVRERYGAVLKCCAVTHLYADYMAARVAADGARSMPAQAWVQHVATTYGREAAAALLPFLGLLAN